MKRLGLALFIIILIIAGFFLFKNSQGTKTATPTSQAKKQMVKEVTITLRKEGFSPETVTIKQGTAVRWKNASSADQTVNSNDYPTNQLHKELNFGIFKDGSSFVHIFKKPGTYTYHNQYQPKQQGKIVVTE